MFDKFVEIICNYVEVEPQDVKPESRFVEDLGFNSFDFMSMMGEIEDEFDIEIDQQKAVDIMTVSDAVAYIESLVAEQ
ncbi:MAG: acyl carrier protein [Ruminococcus sp.]